MSPSLLFLLLTSLLSVASAEEGKRLIQFSPKRSEWMNASEVEKLITKPGIHNFMDITDYQDIGYYKPLMDPIPIPTQPVQQDLFQELQPRVDVSLVTTAINQLSSYFTRYYLSQTGVEAAQWVQHLFQIWAFGRSDIVVSNFTYAAFSQPTIIATIPGGGPNKNSVVVIGAHLDSVGSTPTGRSPGADGDASGTATILEVFRVLSEAEYVPDFTLQFIAYAATEGGLLGSQGIVEYFVKNNIDVYAVLQLDLTGYTINNGYTAAIITDYTSPDLNAFVRTLIQTYTTLKWVNSECGYACSDHVSWNKTGFRSAYPFENPYGGNPNLHTANDLLSNLYPAQLLQFTNLGLGFAIELAGVAPEK